MSLFEIILWTGLAVILFVGLCYLLSFPFIVYFFCCLKEKHTKRKIYTEKPKTHFAILIPARDEKAAIIPLLDCLKEIDYPKDLYDVFVIVPDEKDENYQRAIDYGYTPISRVKDQSNNIKTKGGALADAYKQIEKMKKSFDSFVIFDADGVVDKNFLRELDILRAQGYSVGTSLRDFDNRFDNWSTSSDALFFSFTNAFEACGRNKVAKKGYITGSGYYVDSWILKEAGGWIWTGLTEDVELTDYCLHNKKIKMGFTRYTKIYDELSKDIRQAHKQHLRWMFGYFVSRANRKLIRKNFISNFIVGWDYHVWGLFIIVLLVTIQLYFLTVLGCAFASIAIEPDNTLWFFLLAIGAEVFWFLNTALIASVLLVCDFDNCLTVKQKLFTIVSFPLGLLEFAYGFFEGLFFPKHWKKWDKVQHEGLSKGKGEK